MVTGFGDFERRGAGKRLCARVAGTEAASRRACPPQAATAALAAHDESFRVDISPQRRLYVSKFKGTDYVNVREFYEKDGKALPGAKGVALTAGQWSSLTGLIEKLKARMQ